MPESAKKTNKLIVIAGDVMKPVSTNEKVKQVNNKKQKVPSTLSNPEKLILDTKVFYENEQYSYDDSLYDKKIAEYNHINIEVSKGEMPRALRICDVLVKNLKLLGYTFFLKYGNSYCKTEDNIEVKISLR